ncbi:MAG: inositol monophosphatase [Chloroflexi bacterium]|nr:inositol monophosphatase [Chloroflexota bacterium]
MSLRPPSTSSEFEALHDLAVAVAEEAGALLLAHLHGERTIDSKTSPTDAVTEMDRAAEALIVQRLLAARPDDGLLGEEGASRTGASGVRWVIDPLDGTVNYLYRRAAFGVSVAAELDGRPVAGVVVDPQRGETFHAWRGGGAWLNGMRIRTSDVAALDLALVGTGFDYMAEHRRRQAAMLAEVVHVVRDIRRAGSAALDMCAVACGRLDAYYERGPHWWDAAAGSLIVHEEGGVAEALHPPVLPEGAWAIDTWIAAAPAVADDFRALIVQAAQAAEA